MGAQSNIQVRTFDPFSRLNSDILNRFSKIIVPEGRGIIDGLQVSKLTDNTVRVTAGVAVKEFVVIEYTQPLDLTVNVSVDEYKFVVMTYNYEKVEPAPEAEIRVVSFAELDTQSDLILKILLIDGGIITDLYDIYPPDPNLRREERNRIKTFIEEHNVDTNSHQDIRSEIAQIAASGLELEVEAGEILNINDPVCLIGGKSYKANNDPLADPARAYVVGLAKEAAMIGEVKKVKIGGTAQDGSWNFINAATRLVYLSGQALSDTVPATGPVVVVGLKQASDTVLIRPQFLFLR